MRVIRAVRSGPSGLTGTDTTEEDEKELRILGWVYILIFVELLKHEEKIG